MKRSLEMEITTHCAPTLAGLKPANLFRMRTDDGDALLAQIAQWNQTLQHRGLSLTVLRKCPRGTAFLIYLYRESHLAAELKSAATAAFLTQESYPRPAEMLAEMEDAALCSHYIAQLSERLASSDAFPHEIGLFLGYPLRDVIGFIANKGKNFTHCGHWKTYGDAYEAQKRFAQFEHCTNVYLRCFAQGVPLTRLAVAV